MTREDFLKRLSDDPDRHAEYLDGVAEQRLAAAIGLAVQRLRNERGWTRDELALAVGMQQPEVSRIEAGTAPPEASSRILFRLVRSLQQEITTVLGMDGVRVEINGRESGPKDVFL